MSDAAPEPVLPTSRARPPSNLINSVAFTIFSVLVLLIFITGFGASPSVSATYTAQAAAANVATQPGDAPIAAPTGVAAILRVPEDVPTIQDAVDRALGGQIISVAPGVYHEAVKVQGSVKSHLTIRGRDRNSVILDGRRGDGKYLANGIYVGRDPSGTPANDVIIENMTARYYIGNGFYWNGVTGYRGSYLTAYNNGDYGIYAFASVRGQLDHDYASGSPDSGIYIGQCNPCDALVTHDISEYNALGYSGTNAGGNLVLRDSVWRYNATGIVPNTLDSEANPPEHGTTITHNLVYANNNENVPFKKLEYPPFGIGIIMPGGNDNLITDNTVEGQQNYGILVSGNIDTNLWTPHGNTIMNNTVSGSGIADLALTLPAGPDNCFSGNHITRTVPALLQQSNACGTIGARTTGGDLGIFMSLISRFVKASTWSDATALSLLNRWQTFREPGPQPTMPGAVDAPVAPIFTESWTSGTIDVADPHATNSTKAVAAVGFSSFFAILLGFYSYLLPIALYAAWVGIALWDLARRDTLGAGARYGWMAAVVGVPILGAIAYYIFGKGTLTSGFRWMLVGGSLAIWLVATGALIWLSSL
ncbi:MAG: right-handed parallel beta-helix repeat-containing protein [Ktedonobacterales bacterium]|nr:right-handed parallel beta-helix repeat-containing protein [Ktedonobacterales bacterium]